MGIGLESLQADYSSIPQQNEKRDRKITRAVQYRCIDAGDGIAIGAVIIRSFITQNGFTMQHATVPLTTPAIRSLKSMAGGGLDEFGGSAPFLLLKHVIVVLNKRKIRVRVKLPVG